MIGIPRASEPASPNGQDSGPASLPAPAPLGRRRRWRLQLGMMAWLVVVWCALWGELSWGNVIAGLLLALAVTVLLPMPSVSYHGTVRPWYVVTLVVRFLLNLVVASVQVAWMALRPGRRPRSALIAVKLRSHSDLYLTITAQLCSLVPGSVIVEARRLTGTLYVHILDIGQAGGLDGARSTVLGVERRVMLALASREELREAGLR